VLVSAFLLVFEPMWLALRVGGQTTAFAVLCAALFAHSYVRGRMWRTALSFAGVVIFKPLFAVGALLFVVSRDWKLAGRLMLLGAAFGAASLGLMGWQVHREWLGMMGVLGGDRITSWTSNVAVPAILQHVLVAGGAYREHIAFNDPEYGGPQAPGYFGSAEAVYRYLLLLVVGWIGWRVARENDHVERRRSITAGLALLLPLFCSSVVWQHYLGFLLVPVALAVAHWSSLPRVARWGIPLVLLLTMRANADLTGMLRRQFTLNSVPEAVAVWIYGSGPLLLALSLVLYYGAGAALRPAAWSSGPATRSADRVAGNRRAIR
jgi:hypothetical protein